MRYIILDTFELCPILLFSELYCAPVLTIDVLDLVTLLCLHKHLSSSQRLGYAAGRLQVKLRIQFPEQGLSAMSGFVGEYEYWGNLRGCSPLYLPTWISSWPNIYFTFAAFFLTCWKQIEPHNE